MTLLNGLSLDRNEIMKKVAAVIHDYMEIPVEKILEGTSFSELDSKFDSLAPVSYTHLTLPTKA